MTLEQLSLISQIVSAIAVIASLIFVGIQLSQATAAIRASSSEAHAALYTELVHSIIDNADFAKIWTVGTADPSALSEEEWVRFVAYSSALFRQYETSRVQWLRGRLDDEHWQTIQKQAVSLRTLPGLEAAWRVRGHWYSQDFRDWFEGLEPYDAPGPYERKPRSA